MGSARIRDAADTGAVVCSNVEHSASEHGFEGDLCLQGFCVVISAAHPRGDNIYGASKYNDAGEDLLTLGEESGVSKSASKKAAKQDRVEPVNMAVNSVSFKHQGKLLFQSVAIAMTAIFGPFLDSQ